MLLNHPPNLNQSQMYLESPDFGSQPHSSIVQGCPLSPLATELRNVKSIPSTMASSCDTTKEAPRQHH